MRDRKTLVKGGAALATASLLVAGTVVVPASAATPSTVNIELRAAKQKTVTIKQLKKFHKRANKLGSAKLGKVNFRLSATEAKKLKVLLRKPVQASVVKSGKRFKLQVKGKTRTRAASGVTVTSLPNLSELKGLFGAGNGAPSFAEFMKLFGSGKLLEFGNPGMADWMGTGQGALESMNATLIVTFGEQLGLPASLIEAVNSGNDERIKSELNKAAKKQAAKLGLPETLVDQIEAAAAANDFDALSNLLMEVMQAVMAKLGIPFDLGGLGMPPQGFPPLTPGEFPPLGAGFPGFGGTPFPGGMPPGPPPLPGGGMPPFPPGGSMPPGFPGF